MGRESGRRAPGRGLPWSGAALGAGLAAGGAWLAVAHALFWPPYGPLSFALGALAGLAPAALAGGAVLALGRRLHEGFARLAAVGAASLALLALLQRWVGAPAPEGFAALVTLAAAVGALAELLARGLGRRAARAFVALAVAGGVAATGCALRTGSREAPAALAAGREPGRPGPDPVTRLVYGSGDDRRRPEFGEDAQRTTGRVDAADLVPAWSGLPGRLRTRWWGFGPDALPLNGRAWLPEGPGPFPLALIVHGNHAMEHFSDAGYAYLGEHLASRGIAAVSVDQNFLNRSHGLDLMVPWKGELEARAALLLEHLALWRAWSDDPDDPLAGRVDLERVALIGHSRGGEAVALAALRNREPLRDAAGGPRFAHGFGIRAVVAFAPVQGHARPDGEPLPLAGLSYLVLHGSHDGDLRSFEGVRQLEAVRVAEPDGLKAAVWIEGANHGQFNRDWGARDVLWPLAPLLVRTRLLGAGEQERIAEVFVGAFLGAVLQGERDFVGLLRDPRRAADVLPPVRVRVELREGDFRMLSDFELDPHPGAPRTDAPRYAARGLRYWQEAGVERRWVGAPPATRAVHLGWDRPDPASPPPAFTLRVPSGSIPADAWLGFSLADAAFDAARPPGAEPIRVSLELEDAAGVRARLPLDRFGELRPLYAEPLFWPALLDPRPELVFRSFSVPVSDFADAEPRLDPARLVAMRFVFDGTPSGRLALDDLGWRSASES